jgi:hypothetical protein
MALSMPETESGAPVVARFDTESDVLYISLGEPVESYSEEQPKGLLFRKAYASDKPSGVTAIDFRAHWRGKVGVLSTLVADYLGVPKSAVKAEIKRVT